MGVVGSGRIIRVGVEVRVNYKGGVVVGISDNS